MVIGMWNHRKGLEVLANKPELIGITGVLSVKLEKLVFDDFGYVISDIDLFYETNNGLFIAEYKSGRRERYVKAVRQLRVGSEYVFREYGEYPVCLHVYGRLFRSRKVML